MDLQKLDKPVESKEVKGTEGPEGNSKEAVESLRS